MQTLLQKKFGWSGEVQEALDTISCCVASRSRKPIIAWLGVVYTTSISRSSEALVAPIAIVVESQRKRV